MRDVLRSATVEYGGQCAVTTLTHKMLQLYAGNLAIPAQVSMCMNKGRALSQGLICTKRVNLGLSENGPT